MISIKKSIFLIIAFTTISSKPIYAGELVSVDSAIDNLQNTENNLLLDDNISNDMIYVSPADYDEPTSSGNNEPIPERQIKEIREYSASERMIHINRKEKLEDALAKLPKTWDATFIDGTQDKVEISWTCKDDFYAKKQTSYVFQGYVNNIKLNEDMLSRLVMEVFFDDQVWYVSDTNSCKAPLIERIFSPYTLTLEVEKEQRANEDVEDFLQDYGENADSVIEAGRRFHGEKSILYALTNNVFRSISPTTSNYCYQQLNNEQKAFYDKIDRLVTQYLYYGKLPAVHNDFTCTSYIKADGLTYAEATDIFCIYYCNNPQAFFLTTGWDSFSIGSDVYIAFDFLPDTDTPQKIKEKAYEIAQNLNALSKIINKETTDYKKAKKAQYLLSERISYDEDAADQFESYEGMEWNNWTEGNIMYCQSLMSAFYGNRKQTVCAGYGKGYMALMRLAGVEAFSITSPEHEWNKIYLNGRWYCVDVTWDDEDDQKICSYKYFLKSDKTMNTLEGKDSGYYAHDWDLYWKGIAPKSEKNYNVKLKNYTIKYVLNGGKNNKMNPKTYNKQTGKIKLYKPKRAGYKFIGWYTDKKYKHKITYIKKGTKKNLTLYAKWKRK